MLTGDNEKIANKIATPPKIQSVIKIGMEILNNVKI